MLLEVRMYISHAAIRVPGRERKQVHSPVSVRTVCIRSLHFVQFAICLLFCFIIFEFTTEADAENPDIVLATQCWLKYTLKIHQHQHMG